MGSSPKNMLHRLAIAFILIGFAAVQPAAAQSPAPAAPSPAPAAQSPAPTGAAPDAALTARFSNFLTTILAGKVPATGVSDKIKTGLTPQMVTTIDGALSPLGAFQSLQFVRQNTVQGFQVYHYNAVFAKGNQPMVFVLDSDSNIAGFFKDQPQQ